jgi:hypothetical protein
VRYFRRRWNETRGDRHDAWGHSWWHFATDEDGVVRKQVEVYDNGCVLVYDDHHPEDEFGRLSEAPLDLTEFAEFEVDLATFRREAGTRERETG